MKLSALVVNEPAGSSAPTTSACSERAAFDRNLASTASARGARVWLPKTSVDAHCLGLPAFRLADHLGFDAALCVARCLHALFDYTPKGSSLRNFSSRRFDEPPMSNRF